MSDRQAGVSMGAAWSQRCVESLQ
eukprot:COSAG06_NODE_47386_length_339_cov_1.083333_1_plen_23_part_01